MKVAINGDDWHAAPIKRLSGVPMRNAQQRVADIQQVQSGIGCLGDIQQMLDQPDL